MPLENHVMTLLRVPDQARRAAPCAETDRNVMARGKPWPAKRISIPETVQIGRNTARGKGFASRCSRNSSLPLLRPPGRVATFHP